MSLPLQSFPSDEGWPFAKYLGACGRMVAVNYVGEELWSYYNAPWEKRVDLARQLMDIAEQLTNNDFEFALYLLDVSFDNFAVGPRDGKVIVVDAENVLVADKRLIKQSECVLCEGRQCIIHCISIACMSEWVFARAGAACVSKNQKKGKKTEFSECLCVRLLDHPIKSQCQSSHKLLQTLAFFF